MKCSFAIVYGSVNFLRSHKFQTAKTQGLAFIARIRTKATHDNTQTWSRQTVIHTNLLVWVSGSQIKLHGFEFECVLNDFNSL